MARAWPVATGGILVQVGTGGDAGLKALKRETAFPPRGAWIRGELEPSGRENGKRGQRQMALSATSAERWPGSSGRATRFRLRFCGSPAILYD